MAKLRIFIYSLAVAFASVLAVMNTSCSDDNMWGELPDEIQKFLATYFPEQGVTDFTESNGTYRVKLKNSAAMVFNKSYLWTSVNGYGTPLPEIFLFDEFPPALYEYLTVTDNLKAVYSVTRDSSSYVVDLLNSTISYDRSSGDISPVVSGDAS